MKTKTPAFLARQYALSDREWIELIKVQAAGIGKNLHNLTLKPLGELRIIFDDYGRHSLRDNSGKCGFARGYESFRNIRGIYPPEDDRISVNEFIYAGSDTQNSKPIGVIQRLWGFSESKSWFIVEVRSDITYVNQHPHLNRRWVPKQVEVEGVELDDKFFKFIGLTPRKFWHLFTCSLEQVLKKRREYLNDVLEMEGFIRETRFRLNGIPESGVALFE
jgi:hypothetical protein